MRSMRSMCSMRFKGRRLATLILVVALIAIAACAPFQGISTTSEKYQRALSYYQLFSAGLHATVQLMPSQYAVPANAALQVADTAIGMLGSMLVARASQDELEDASAKAAASVATANAMIAEIPVGADTRAVQ